MEKRLQSPEDEMTILLEALHNFPSPNKPGYFPKPGFQEAAEAGMEEIVEQMVDTAMSKLKGNISNAEEVNLWLSQVLKSFIDPTPMLAKITGKMMIRISQGKGPRVAVDNQNLHEIITRIHDRVRREIGNNHC